MKVFISGSISIKSLKNDDLEVLEKIIEDNRIILIGDAYGVDRAVQEILAERGYRSVVVYFSSEKPRNNIGAWLTKQIPNPENLTGRSRYQLKDKAMADDCDSGIMFWDGKSKGTKHNMDCLKKLGKPYRVFEKIKNVVSGNAGDLDFTFADGVLTISGNGEIPDYNVYIGDDPTVKGRSPWYSFRKEIKKIVFKGNISKKDVYAFSGCDNLTSVTFDGCNVPIPYFPYISFNTKDIIDRALQGYTLGDIWELRCWFPLQMTRMLQEFKQKSACCHPAGMSHQEWNAILERMIFCFSEIGLPFGDDKEKTEYRQKMKQEAFELLYKYFGHLWW